MRRPETDFGDACSNKPRSKCNEKQNGDCGRGVTVGLMVTGIAFAAQDVDESTVNVSLAENQTVTLPVDNAGVVVLSRANGQLQIVSATPNSRLRRPRLRSPRDREVEADFRGNGERVQFNAELEDGVVRVRIRTEALRRQRCHLNHGRDLDHRSTSPPVRRRTSPTSTTTATVRERLGEPGSGRWTGETVVVADAGSVLLRRNGGSLTIVSTESNPGWVVEVEVATGREVEGDFRNGSRRVKFNFELEDGVVRVRIESEGSTREARRPQTPRAALVRPAPRTRTSTTAGRPFQPAASPTTSTPPEPSPSCSPTAE